MHPKAALCHFAKWHGTTSVEHKLPTFPMSGDCNQLVVGNGLCWILVFVRGGIGCHELRACEGAV